MRRVLTASFASIALVASCKSPPTADHEAPPPPSAVTWRASSAPSPSAEPPTSVAEPTSSAPPPAPAASGELYATSLEDLLKMFSVRPFTEKERKLRGGPELFLDKNFGLGDPAHINQGNPELAHHAISRAECLEGLRGVTLQTEEQKAICGADLMVPIFRNGGKPKACIDVFEFPNKPCELPFVWVAPTQAAAICEMQGKRLCTQEEWTVACKGDPEGKDDWIYAYGNELDLAICNTDKPARSFGGPVCEPDSARTAWKTCGTNTEPTGSFPKCRSRLGVFDMHGNVAEIMTRLDPDDGLVSQLKGSAFFYVDVARKHDERPPKDATRETYPDHCAYDPRWHVEPMSNAWHVNYHLGFRCCKTVRNHK